MSKRITLTDFEIDQIVHGLRELRSQCNLDYEVIKMGKRYYDSLIAKLSPSVPIQSINKGRIDGTTN